MPNKSKETKVFQVDDKPNYSKVDKVYVTNQSGSGGGGNGEEFDGTIAWGSVTGKPQTFPPSEHDHDELYSPAEHNHDGRYYTKDEIDAPEFLADRVDNATVALEGRELKVRSVDGLVIGIVDINEWLAGTSGNIQTQIDGINDSLVTLTSGMRYLGKQESYSDMEDISSMENGDLVVVLADENRTGGRSMYVYRDDRGMWDFIGEFTFSDEFTSLKDTPESYAGADGKVVKVAGERLVFDDVDYTDLASKPESTITEIDDAVGKRHDHDNKGNLDVIGESADGVLTYKGEEYVRKSDIEVPQKQFLHAGRVIGSNQTLTRSTRLRFNAPLQIQGMTHDVADGFFTLEKDKTYFINTTVSMFVDDPSHSVVLELVAYEDGATAGGVPPETRAMAYINATSRNSAANTGNTFSTIVRPARTRRFAIRVKDNSGTGGLMVSDGVFLSIFEI